jgi:hypothetical protein
MKTKITSLIALFFAFIPMMTGCGKTEDSSASNKGSGNLLLYAFSLQNDISLGDTEYVSTAQSSYKQDKVIGYVIKEDAVEGLDDIFEEKEGYFYVYVDDFYLYDYKKSYLFIYSIKDVDYHESVSIGARDFYVDYVNENWKG